MSLVDQLQADLKTAMRAGDGTARETLRMVIAGVKNRRIEAGRELEESEVLEVLEKAVKTRTDSATQYDSAGRDDLAQKERAEIEVIQGYLPQKLSDEETRTIVAQAIDQTGATAKKDLGRVMKAVMADHKGRVDGKVVQRLAAELLKG